MTAHIQIPAMPDDLAALGWRLEQAAGGWIAKHEKIAVGSMALPKPEDAIEAARSLERAASNPKIASMTETTRQIAAARQQEVTEQPGAATWWGRGPQGKSAKAVHCWEEPEPYSWRSLCGSFIFSERRPGSDASGNRCPTCVQRDRDRQAGPAMPPSSKPTIDPDHLFKRPLWAALDGKDTYEVDLETLVAGRWQPRQAFDDAEIERLANSLKEHGLLTPIKVFFNEHNRFELIAGERRVRAARRLGWTVIRAEIVEWTARQIHEVSVIDNLQRQQLNAVEEGRAFDQLLVQLGISENKLADRMGVNRAYIQQRRALAKASPEVQQALLDGAISLSQARAIALCAPGYAQFQNLALERIKQLGGYGRVTEEDVRKKATRIVFDGVRQSLQKLGWKVSDPGQYSSEPPLVFSKYDRPSVWTGAEMLAVVRELRKPIAQDVVAAGELPEADLVLFKSWYGSTSVTTSKFAPWIELDTKKVEYLTPQEAMARAQELREEQAQASARAEAHGWTLTHNPKSYRFDLQKPSMETLSAWKWSDLLGHLKKIEGGFAGNTIESVQEKAVAQASRSGSLCACGQPGYYCFVDGSALYQCSECRKRREAQTKAEQAALYKVILSQSDWMEHIPLEVLHLLVVGLDAFEDVEALNFEECVDINEKVQIVQKTSPAVLCAALAELIASSAWVCRDTPLAVAVSVEQPEQEPAEQAAGGQ